MLYSTIAYSSIPLISVSTTPVSDDISTKVTITSVITNNDIPSQPIPIVAECSWLDINNIPQKTSSTAYLTIMRPILINDLKLSLPQGYKALNQPLVNGIVKIPFFDPTSRILTIPIGIKLYEKQQITVVTELQL